jgi:hypothetical protein
MPARDQATRVISARLAAVERHHPDADTSELRRQLRAARAEDYIRRLIDSAPPLTDEQRARLATLLHPAPVGGPAA